MLQPFPSQSPCNYSLPATPPSNFKNNVPPFSFTTVPHSLSRFFHRGLCKEQSQAHLSPTCSCSIFSPFSHNLMGQTLITPYSWKAVCNFLNIPSYFMFLPMSLLFLLARISLPSPSTWWDLLSPQGLCEGQSLLKAFFRGPLCCIPAPCSLWSLHHGFCFAFKYCFSHRILHVVFLFSSQERVSCNPLVIPTSFIVCLNTLHRACHLLGDWHTFLWLLS